MDPLHFAYWLRGYTEITNGAQPDATQWQIIQDHLNEVFTKVTPDRYPLVARPIYDGLSVTGCGYRPKDPTLPQPGNTTLYCGARVRERFQPAGDAIITLTSTDYTC